MTDIVATLEELMAAVADGGTLAVFKDNAAMAATRALIRKGVRNVHLVTVPTSGLQAELLIAAGCIATVETSGISLGELGPAPAFVRAVKSGKIRILDATCPAVYAGLQATEKGNPFMPIRGLLGSDVLANRADYRVIDNPYPPHDPIVTVPAIRPDIALFHAPLADRAGNVWIGRQPELKLMAHAAAITLVTVEAIQDANLLEDETMAPATIPAFYVTAIAPAEHGAWPLGLPGRYGPDLEALAAYRDAAATEAGLRAWLTQQSPATPPASPLAPAAE